MMTYTSALVVIPTRNRPTIAMNAIRSVLSQPVSNLELIVSDNSTAETDREILAGFCSTLSDKRLRYLRPPQSLSMTSHWEWAIQQVLRLSEASHFIYLTDRMMFRRGALKEVVDLAALYPEKIISYNIDRIVDHVRPIRIEEYPATGRLFEVETEQFTRLFSQALFHPGLPRMLNNIVPRELLTRMAARFGDVFSSIAPDFSFCCRCLDMEKTIFFYDKSPLFHYALHRSNGASVTRGEMTPDNADFSANLPVDNSIRNYATPIPALNTAINGGFNEYFLFQQQTGSPRFFEVDMQKYLAANACEVREVKEPKLRAEMLSMLVAKGYREAEKNGQPVAVDVSLLDRIRSKLKRGLTGGPTTRAWLLAARTLGIRPPGGSFFEFATVEDAIDYASNVSIGNITNSDVPEQLLKARAIPTQ
jgi:hypothetical protein